jgi:thymidine kinase
MSLEIIIGPMFAGKSSAILQRVKREQSIGTKVLIVTSVIDTRYVANVNLVKTHDSQVAEAVGIRNIDEIFLIKGFEEASLVIIEEAQFFTKLYDTVRNIVDVCGKNVVVVGLDGDSDRKPFGEILQLIPLCDTVTKLKALCKRCAFGSGVRKDAIFSACFTGKEDQVSVGGDDKYEAVCRDHFITR